MKPKLSVIIPMHNAEKTIGKCISSIYKSTFKSFEVIVVDDASTDDSLGIIEKLPCKLIKLKSRKGPAFARNKGAKTATGKILVFLDSDCFAKPGWLTRICNHLKSPNIGAVAGKYYCCASNSFVERFALYELVWRERKFPKFLNVASSCNFSCKRDLFFKVGSFSEKIKYASVEDVEFSYRLSKLTKILWDPKLGVGHHFPNTIPTYLKQQFVHQLGITNILRKYSELLVKKTHHDKINYIEVPLTFIAVLTLPLLLWWSALLPIIPLSLALIAFLNIGFLHFIFKKGRLNIILALFLIFLRNLTWLVGLIYDFLIFNFIQKRAS